MHRDLASGSLFALTGAAFAFFSSGLDLGTTRNMGPGYFPLVVSILLIGLGAAIAGRACFGARVTIAQVYWRRMAFAIAGPLAFALTIRSLGLVLAVALSAFLSMLASPQGTVVRAASLGLGLSAFCVLVFHFGVALPIPLFGTVFD